MFMDVLLDLFAAASLHTGNAALLVSLPCCHIDYHMAQVDIRKSDLLLQRHRLRSEASWLSNLKPALLLTW